MKKRLLTLTLAVLLVVPMLLLTVGCSSKEEVEKLEYDSVDINPYISSEFSTSADLFNFVYEDTYLKLYEDGTWVIDTPIFLFFNSDIDKGTYTVEDGVYTFYGFEYDMDTYGKFENGMFEIYFMMPDGTGYTKAFSIYYK